MSARIRQQGPWTVEHVVELLREMEVAASLQAKQADRDGWRELWSFYDGKVTALREAIERLNLDKPSESEEE